MAPGPAHRATCRSGGHVSMPIRLLVIKQGLIHPEIAQELHAFEKSSRCHRYWKAPSPFITDVWGDSCR